MFKLSRPEIWTHCVCFTHFLSHNTILCKLQQKHIFHKTPCPASCAAAGHTFPTNHHALQPTAKTHLSHNIIPCMQQSVICFLHDTMPCKLQQKHIVGYSNNTFVTQHNFLQAASKNTFFTQHNVLQAAANDALCTWQHDLQTAENDNTFNKTPCPACYSKKNTFSMQHHSLRAAVSSTFLLDNLISCKLQGKTNFLSHDTVLCKRQEKTHFLITWHNSLQAAGKNTFPTQHSLLRAAASNTLATQHNSLQAGASNTCPEQHNSLQAAANDAILTSATPWHDTLSVKDLESSISEVQRLETCKAARQSKP